jgi:hypothetical protein
MRFRIGPRDVLAVTAAVATGALILATVAFADSERRAVIEPLTRVSGMLVVQGAAQQSPARLFPDWCDPVVLTPGRRTRSCGRIPRTSRLYIGYGLFESPSRIGRTWNASKWDMWIDGQRVDLQAFGTADRTLPKYPPAGNKDVVLREWNVTLLRPTTGRHTIRYRTREPHGVTDTTWTFTVPAS